MELSFSDMLKSTKKPMPEPENPEVGSLGKAAKKKGKKGRQIDPSLLGFKVHSNRILMGEIQRPDDWGLHLYRRQNAYRFSIRRMYRSSSNSFLFSWINFCSPVLDRCVVKQGGSDVQIWNLAESSLHVNTWGCWNKHMYSSVKAISYFPRPPPFQPWITFWLAGSLCFRVHLAYSEQLCWYLILALDIQFVS